MMARITLEQLLEMPTADRVELAQAIWDSVGRTPEKVAITDAQRQDLDRRLEAFEQEPDAGSTWESIKRSLRGE